MPMWNGRPAWLVKREALAGLSDEAECPTCSAPNAAHYRVPTPQRSSDVTVLLCPDQKDVEKLRLMVKRATKLPDAPPPGWDNPERRRQFVMQAMKLTAETFGTPFSMPVVEAEAPADRDDFAVPGEKDAEFFIGGRRAGKTTAPPPPPNAVSSAAVDMGLLMSSVERDLVRDTLADETGMGAGAREWERRRLAIVNTIERLNREAPEGTRYRWDADSQSVKVIREQRTPGGTYVKRTTARSPLAQREIDKVYQELQTEAKQRREARMEQERRRTWDSITRSNAPAFPAASAPPAQRPDTPKPQVEPTKRKRAFEFE